MNEERVIIVCCVSDEQDINEKSNYFNKTCVLMARSIYVPDFDILFPLFSCRAE